MAPLVSFPHAHHLAALGSFAHAHHQAALAHLTSFAHTHQRFAANSLTYSIKGEQEREHLVSGHGCLHVKESSDVVAITASEEDFLGANNFNLYCNDEEAEECNFHGCVEGFLKNSVL